MLPAPTEDSKSLSHSSRKTEDPTGQPLGHGATGDGLSQVEFAGMRMTCPFIHASYPALATSLTSSTVTATIFTNLAFVSLIACIMGVAVTPGAQGGEADAPTVKFFTQRFGQ